MLYFIGDCFVTNREEGEDDVKSAWRLRPGRHTSYNGWDNGLRRGNPKLILQIHPQFRLQAAIRLHEVGIGSNRGSADRGEYVLAPCTNNMRLTLVFFSWLESNMFDASKHKRNYRLQ
jgi:hypothetical protein